MSTNPRTRESPPWIDPSEFRDVSDGGGSYKTAGGKDGSKATREKTAGREPRQEIARQQPSRDSQYTPRSHKSIPRRRWGELPDSQIRMDSREETYFVLEAVEGQHHE